MTAPNRLGTFDTLARCDDIGDQVSAIRVPTLIIHGDADAPIPLAKAQAMQASIPNAELVVEGGHSINMTNPAPVNAAIEAFPGMPSAGVLIYGSVAKFVLWRQS
jgi:pimeloyl-ACP methyl ester carboxylesterase